MCVLSVATSVCWVGLSMKMQTWEIQAAPLHCTVRNLDHAFNLQACACVCVRTLWGESHFRYVSLRLCMSVSGVCVADTAFIHSVSLIS